MQLDIWPVFFKLVRLHGGPAPVRRYLPDLIKLVWDRKIDPGKVFDLVLPLEKVAEGYRAMDERRAYQGIAAAIVSQEGNAIFPDFSRSRNRRSEPTGGNVSAEKHSVYLLLRHSGESAVCPYVIRLEPIS